MYLGLDTDIGSQPLFEGELLDTNSGNPVNIASPNSPNSPNSPKLQRETDSAGTPTSKLLFDYTIAQVENNSNRIDKSVLKADFCNTLDKTCQEVHQQNCEELFKQSLENALEIQGRVEKVSHIDIGSLSPLFEGELLDDIGSSPPLFAGDPLDTNSGDPVNIALPKLQRETDSAGTPDVTAQNLVVNFEAAPLQPSKINNDFPKTAFLPPNFEQSDYIIAKQSLENALNTNFCNTLDKICQGVHHQNCEELVTAQNLVGNFTETPQQSSKINTDFPENAFLPPNFEQLQELSKQSLENALNTNFCNTLDKICQEVHHQNCEKLVTAQNLVGNFTETPQQPSKINTDFPEHAFLPPNFEQLQELSKQSLENALESQGRADEDFIKEKVSHIDIGSLPPLFAGDPLDTNSGDPVNIALPKLQRETDSASTPASKLLSDVTAQNLVGNFEAAPLQPIKINNDFPKTAFLPPNFGQLLSDYIIAKQSLENALNTDFCNTFDKICQGVYHQNCEELVTAQNLVGNFTETPQQPSKINTDFPENAFLPPNFAQLQELSKQSPESALEFQNRADEDFIKKKVSHIDIGSSLFEGELPDTNSGDPVNIALPKLQQQTDSAGTPASKLLSDDTVAEVENNSNRIDESVLKENFHNLLDEICQKKHHQNFEELSKQSLKNALEIQGEVYRDFTKKKAELSKKQLVSPGEYKYPCIVNNCAFTHIQKTHVETHLFKHIKVSQYYCEQCLPHHTLFVRDKSRLNRHIRRMHSTGSTLSKYRVKRMCLPVQNTMNGSSGFTVNQVSDQQKTDSASTPASKLLFDVTAQNLVGNFTETSQQPSKINTDFPENAFLLPNFEQLQELSKQSPENALEFQCRADENFIKEKVSDIGSLLFEVELPEVNSDDQIDMVLPKLQRETDSASTPASKLLFDVTAQNLVGNFTETSQQPSKINTDFPENAFLLPNFEQLQELSKQSPENALEFQCRADENFIKEKVSDIGSLLFEVELPEVNSDDQIDMVLPKLQRETDSASTPASNLLSDDTIAEVENNSTRIDESALKEDFYTTLDKKCQEEHRQNFEELSKQSLKNALKIQAEFYENFIKEKVKLSKRQLLPTNRYGYPCIVTNCLFTHLSRLNVQRHLFKHTKVSQHYCEQCLPHKVFTRDAADLNKHKENVHSLDTAIPKRGIKRIHQPVQNTMNGSSGFTVNQVSDQQKTDSTSTQASKLLSDDTIAEVENNSNRIDKIFQEVHHQNCEELSKQSLENAPEFQVRADEDFIKEKVSYIDTGSLSPLFWGELPEVNSDDQIDIVLSQLQREIDSASTPASNLLSDYTIAQVENNSKYQDHCNQTFSSSNTSNSKDSRKKANSQILSKGSRKKANSQILSRIDENVLKTGFYTTLDKKCQEKYHQNFEELSKQSLKDALEFQGKVYEDFTKEKVQLSKKQLVSPGRYEYPCIVNNCVFAHINKINVKTHLFKHIKVSPYYCEQCLPHKLFFVRDKSRLNRHIRRIHSTGSTLSKYRVKRMCLPVQNTMNGSSGFTVNQVSDQQKTDSASTPASNLLSDDTIAEVEDNSTRIDESALKEDFYKTFDKKCQEVHYQNCEELSKQSPENALEFQGRADEDFIKEKSDIDSLSPSPLFEGELHNSDDPVNIALPKLQRETNSASTPASNLLSDDTIAQVENNSNRTDKICQEVHYQNCEELSKQSPENALEFQNRADEDFIKKKVSDIDSPSPLFEGELLNTNSGDPVNIALPKLQQQTDSASTPASKLLSDDTIAEVENNSNRIDESVLKENFHNFLDEICQEKHHQNFEELSKQSLKKALKFQGRVYEDFTKEKVKLSEKQLVPPGRYKYPCIVNNCAFTHIQKTHVETHLFKHIKVSQYYCEQCLPHKLFFVRDKSRLNRHIRRIHSTGSTLSKYRVKRMCLPVQNTMNGSSGFTVNQVSDQQKTDSASTPASNLLSDDTIAQVENNSNRTDKICQEVHYQNCEELSKQSPENALEFQNRADEDFIKKKVSDIDSPSPLFEGELLNTNSGDPVNIALPKLQQQTDSASTPASKLLSDDTIAEVENNSNRIDESVLKENFHNFLDEICQEKHHQNFEELSKQSLKKALKFQGRVYEDFTKEKVKLSEKQLVSSDRYEYPCIVTDCSFTEEYRSKLGAHLFKHIKVSPYYCKQCLPNIFFARDTTDLSKHKRRVHRSVIPKRSIKRIHKPDQNTIVENNSNRIDESVLKEYFCNTLDEKCQEKHNQNFEELSKQSLKKALKFQGSVYQDFTEKKAKLSKQLVSSDKCEYQCIVTDCAFKHKHRVTIKRHLFKHIKVSPYYCEQCLPDTFFARDMVALNAHKKSLHSLDTAIPKRGIKRIHQPVQNTMNGSSGFTVNQVSDQQKTDSASTPASNLLSDDTIAEVESNSNRIDKICQEVHHQNCEELSKQSPENALEFQGRADEDFIKGKVSDIDSLSPSPLFEGELPDTNSGDPVNIALPKLQRETDSASTPASKLLSDDTIAEVENNSNRIDESVLKEDFHNLLDKICQEKHHQNFEELSKQSLKNALEIQGEFYENFIKEKVQLSKKQLVSTNRYGYPCIVTNCSFTEGYRSKLGAHLFKHIKVSPHYCEKCLPDIFFARNKTDLAKHKKSIHRSAAIPKRSIKRIHKPDQNTIVENNSARIDESVLKEAFYSTLDKKCQEEHDQNFEELSKQSLKNALEFQGRVYQHFTKEKVNFFEKQLVLPDGDKYPCVVTDCSFKNERKVIIKRHLFQHIKVSPYYCEQCLPHTFFARDMAALNAHKKKIHSLDTAISKRSIKRRHKPVQNTMNGSSGFTANQVSDPCLPLSGAKQAKIDP